MGSWLSDTWVFMKAAPWTFAVGGLILAGAIAGVIYGVLKQYDRGFMVKDGKTLHWSKKDVPIVFAYTIPFYMVILQKVIAEINVFCGKEIINPTLVSLSDGNSFQMNTTINVLVDLDTTLPKHVGGQTKLNWDKRTGELLAAYINLPEQMVNTSPYVIIAHEVGHSLGLDHDDKSESMMHEKVSGRKQNFTKADKKRLRKRYA